MPQKVIFICQDCKSKWEAEDKSKACRFCGSLKVYKSYKQQRAARKSRSKERWAYKTR
jgi:transposase-like protein